MSAIPQKLGIVAGGGALPARLLEHCQSQQVATYVVGFDGHTDPAIADMMTRLGAAGSIIKTFKDKGYRDLVIIGAVKRPKFSEMRPDLRTAAFLAKLGLRALGDDGLLKAVRAELESEGFVIHGIQDVMDDLMMPLGVLGTAQPSDEQYEDIRIGLNESRDIGKKDIGQSVVVLHDEILGTEDEEGTNALIKRAAVHGAILVKSSKPQQDRKLDMPTIGSHTVELCASLGYAGIAAEAGGVLLADRAEMIDAANCNGLFVVGV